jgi:hypothetical protein
MKFEHEIDSSSWTVMHRLVAILDDGTRREGMFCKYDAPAFISDEEIAGLDVPAVPRDGFIAFTEYFDGECPRIIRYQEAIFSVETKEVDILSHRLSGIQEDEVSESDSTRLPSAVCDQSSDADVAESYVKHGGEDIKLDIVEPSAPDYEEVSRNNLRILGIDPGAEHLVFRDVATGRTGTLKSVDLVTSLNKFLDDVKGLGPIPHILHHPVPMHTFHLKVSRRDGEVVTEFLDTPPLAPVTSLSEFREQKETAHAPLAGLSVERHDDPTHREDEAHDESFSLKP